MGVAGRVAGMLAVTACLTFAATAANAAYILDFTDRSAGAPGALPFVPGGSFAGTTYSVTATGGSLNASQGQDGTTCHTLACVGDGLGVGDDEIAPNQSIKIAFGKKININKIFLLDLFTSTDGSTRERATVSWNGGSVDINADLAERPGTDSGFLVYTFAGLILTDYLEFTAPFLGLDVNDGLGVNDYAVAGVSAVPLPAAFPLFASALGFMGLLSWWRRRRTATV